MRRPRLPAALLATAVALAGCGPDPRPVDDKDGPWPPVVQPLVAERTLPIAIGVRPFRAAAQTQPTFEPFVGWTFPSTAFEDRLKAGREAGLPAEYATVPRAPALSVVERRPGGNVFAGTMFDPVAIDVGRDAAKALAAYLRAAQVAREVRFGTDFEAKSVDLVVEGWVVDLRSSGYVDQGNVGIIYLLLFGTAGIGIPFYYYALEDYLEGRVHVVLVARRPGNPKPVAWTTVAHDWSKAFPRGEGAVEREKLDQAAVREALGICFREFLDDLVNVGGIQNLGAERNAPAPAKSVGGGR